MSRKRSQATAKASSKPMGESAEDWVDCYGNFLFGHALLRVGQRQTAEDLVQEVFLAAWKSRERFAHRSSEKTWLFQILRNKIADYYRQSKPEISLAEMDDLQELENKQFEPGVFGAHWGRSVAPKHWRNPRKSLENSEFWRTVGECLGGLPGKVGQAFALREVDGLETDEICRRLNIKSSNLFVILHRARLGMRRCLELHWFRSSDKSSH